MNQEIKPTYEELEEEVRRHERWSWKRALLAVGFGSILPVLVMAIFLARTWHNSPSLRSGQNAHAVPADEAFMEVIQQERQARMKAMAAARTESYGQTAPNASLGLLAISAFGLGLLAFRKREVHDGWGISAAAGILFGLVLTVMAVDRGSFMAFDTFLSLKPAELLSLSVGNLGLILVAFVSGALGLLQIPDLLFAVFTLVGAVLSGVGHGIGRMASAYGSFCWFLACKSV